ncbi:MAG TPA: glutamine amidotransferase [Syntrophorhabdaceae bacterium]|jgi:GMP synthase (glutamine-hydrolysing)
MKNRVIIKTGSTFPDIASHAGDFENWIIAGTGQERHSFTVIDVTRAEPLPSVTDFSGVIITGSHSMITDCSDWGEKTGSWLREIASSGMPALGICYGHQLLAHAFGGKAGHNPMGREFGTVELTLRESAATDPLFAGLPSLIKAHACHTQSVLTLPPGATLLASSPLDPHQAFRIGSSTWGVQFHPEFDEATVREYIKRHRDMLREEGKEPDALIKTVEPTPHAASLLKRFIEFAGR